MWQHHDLGWWGFVLALATLILAYPLDVLAHLTSPKVRDWWASRSRSSLQKRINSLQEELRKIEALPLMSETEDMILTSAQVTHALIWNLGYILIFLIWFSLVSKPEEQKFDVLWSFLFLTAYAIVFCRPIHMYRVMRSPRFRQKFAKEIDKLKNKLKKKSI